MNKKKVFLGALALVLVCVMSVMGTVAFMQMNTGAVTNTFIAAGGGKLATNLTLLESKAIQADNGSYTLGSEKVNANTYEAMPGMTLPKDPTITIEGKTDAPAYLYLEVCGALPAAYSWTIDAGWEELTGVTGSNDGKVYVWNQIISAEGTHTYNIIKDKQITIAGDATGESLVTTDENNTLTFYAYLAQATVGENSDATSVYNTCFK